MYQKYSERNSWKFSPLSSSEVGLLDTASMILFEIRCVTEISYFSSSFLVFFFLFKAEKGGFKTYVMEIKGNHVYSKLKYESGVHRVQRVPQTEAQGRVHTSTATVAIMPEVDYIFSINDKCLCTSGASIDIHVIVV